MMSREEKMRMLGLSAPDPKDASAAAPAEMAPKKSKKKKAASSSSSDSSSSSSDSSSSDSDSDDESTKKKKKGKGKGKDDEKSSLSAESKAIEVAEAAMPRVRQEIDTSRAGGVYIPPFKLARMRTEIKDKTGDQYQRTYWDALRKSINGLVNKVRAACPAPASNLFSDEVESC